MEMLSLLSVYQDSVEINEIRTKLRIKTRNKCKQYWCLNFPVGAVLDRMPKYGRPSFMQTVEATIKRPTLKHDGAQKIPHSKTGKISFDSFSL